MLVNHFNDFFHNYYETYRVLGPTLEALGSCHLETEDSRIWVFREPQSRQQILYRIPLIIDAMSCSPIQRTGHLFLLPDNHLVAIGPSNVTSVLRYLKGCEVMVDREPVLEIYRNMAYPALTDTF